MEQPNLFCSPGHQLDLVPMNYRVVHHGWTARHVRADLSEPGNSRYKAIHRYTHGGQGGKAIECRDDVNTRYLFSLFSANDIMFQRELAYLSSNKIMRSIHLGGQLQVEVLDYRMCANI